MPESIVALESFSAKDFLSQKNLDCIDEAVGEVSGMMLGFEVEEISESEAARPGESKDKIARVGFSGSMLGSCEICMTSLAAQSIASAMLGSPVEEDDESIDDAVGELCNMFAGGWKNRVPPLASMCSLSPPTVISGGNYKVQLGGPSLTVSRLYQFDGHKLQLTLDRDDVARGPAK
jgi:chemotaxis protein CheX